ncbi:MAG: CvpA family protein [Bacteroidales bacterium]|nr:CvpA family protein [Bacteroidales bacterium]
MNILDIIFIIPIVWFAYRGFSKGLIIGITTLVALILGIYLSIRFSDIVAAFLMSNFDWDEKYIPIISFAITFVGVVIVIYFLGKILEKFIDMIALGFINKLLGGVFGIVKAVVLLSVIIYIINSFDRQQKVFTEKLQQGSILYEPVESVVPRILPLLDIEEIKKKIPLKEEPVIVVCSPQSAVII